ncbi:MAG: 2-oxoacid:acceptor oxidoreductase family protein [Clostridia bacterium]|nr:2-oxoacid:acceptor oxidoreductase family protein [Clostridia bacterium]
MKQSFVFSGSGGQGIMSAGITLAHTAIDMGKHATYLPEYGPEQRGGSAKCTVVINDAPIVSPLPTRCDNLIVMNEQAYRKFGEDVKPGGVLLINSSRIPAPETRDDVTVIAAPVDDIALELGSPRIANTVLLGILIGATEIVAKETLALSLEDKFKEKKPEILEMNIKALDRGIAIGAQHKLKV